MTHVDLDMDGYMRLGRLRQPFDDWLRAEHVMERNVIALRFGEGCVEAHCLVDLPNSARAEWIELPVSALPPPEVLDAIRYVAQGGSIIGQG